MSAMSDLDNDPVIREVLTPKPKDTINDILMKENFWNQPHRIQETMEDIDYSRMPSPLPDWFMKLVDFSRASCFDSSEEFVHAVNLGLDGKYEELNNVFAVLELRLDTKQNERYDSAFIGTVI